MRPQDCFKLMLAGGRLDDMRRSLSENSAEYLKVVRPKDIYHVVARRRWNVGALQTTLEDALLPTVGGIGQKRLLEVLQGQIFLRRFNVPLTDAVAEALGPHRIPLYLACTALSLSGYNANEAAMTTPQPFLDAVLAARSKAFQLLEAVPAFQTAEAFNSLIETLVVMRQRGYSGAPVGDAIAATAGWVEKAGTSEKPLSKFGAMKLWGLRHKRRGLKHRERQALWNTVIQPMYRRILDALPTASVQMVVTALTIAPTRDFGRIGQRLVAITGNNDEAFFGILRINVIRLAQRALVLSSPTDAAHLHRLFSHWCRMQSRLSPSQSVNALVVLTKAQRMSPITVRKVFVDVRNMVHLFKSRDVTRVLIAMARCKCVDTALLGGLIRRALVIAVSWQDNEIAPAILAMAHLHVVCLPVVAALVRRLWTFSIGIRRRDAPKVVEALAALIA